MNNRQRNQTRRLLRIARFVCELIDKPNAGAAFPKFDSVSTIELQRLSRQHEIAVSKGWHHASDRLRGQAKQVAVDLLAEVAKAAEQLCHTSPPNQTSVAEMMQELGALEVEFGDIELDRVDQTLSVTTEEIELEGYEFGPFRICLELRYSGEHQPYRVIAEDPRESNLDDDVTHPDRPNCHDGDGQLQRRRRCGIL